MYGSLVDQSLYFVIPEVPLLLHTEVNLANFFSKKYLYSKVRTISYLLFLPSFYKAVVQAKEEVSVLKRRILRIALLEAKLFES